MWWVVGDTGPERFQALDCSETKMQAGQVSRAFEQGDEPFPGLTFYVVEAESRAEAMSKVATIVQEQENDEWLAKRRSQHHRAS